MFEQNKSNNLFPFSTIIYPSLTAEHSEMLTWAGSICLHQVSDHGSCNNSAEQNSTKHSLFVSIFPNHLEKTIGSIGKGKIEWCINMKYCQIISAWMIYNFPFQTSENEDLDLEVSDIEVPDYDLEADFDVPDVDFNVSDV